MPWKPWLLAARPKTLPAAVAPVLVGTALAAHDGAFQVWSALICLTFALLIQIGANYANDYFDFVRGTDNEDRLGPTRAVAAGWVSPSAMKLATLGVLSLAFLVGLTLVCWGGWWLVAVGIASVIGAIIYTGGPYPLAYHGLGDLFVLVFFGLIAVGFTYYVQAGEFSPAAWWLGAAVGALSMNLLVVNNYRDFEGDRRAGKRTLVVRWGRDVARGQYAASVLFALLAPATLAWLGYGWGLLLPLLLIPLAWRRMGQLANARTLADFQVLLAGTAQLLFLASALIALGLVF